MRLKKNCTVVIIIIIAIFVTGCSMFERIGNAISPKHEQAMKKVAVFSGYNYEYMKEYVESGEVDIKERIPFFEMGYEEVSPLFLAPDPPYPNAEYLLQQGADPNIAFGDTTLLMWKTGERGIQDTTSGELYIRYGADVNARNADGHSALYNAVKFGRAGYVKLLLENGAIVTQEDIDMLELSVKTFFTERTSDEQEVSRWRKNSSAFYTIPALIYEAAEKQGGEARPADAVLQAVLTGDSGAVIEGAEVVGVSDVLSYLAAAYCKADVMESLVSQGLDVSLMRENGMTLLWMATASGNIETVQYLVENGASIHYGDYENAEGYSEFHPLISAIQNDNMDVVRYLLENGFEFHMALERGVDLERSHFTGTMLIATAESGNAEYIPLLIEHGYEIDENIGYVGMKYAILEHQDEALEALLKLRLDPNYSDERFGILASPLLEYCATDGTLETIKLLNEYGQNMKNGNTDALNYVAEFGTYEVMKYMLDAGMPVDACDDWGTDNEGGKAIYDAAYSGYLDKVKLLVERGADINDPYAPALSGTAGSSKNILEYLLDAGAEVNLQDAAGGTALMQAALNNNVINMQILLDAGADKTLKDRDGWTAYDYAKENDAKDAMKLLR